MSAPAQVEAAPAAVAPVADRAAVPLTLAALGLGVLFRVTTELVPSRLDFALGGVALCVTLALLAVTGVIPRSRRRLLLLAGAACSFALVAGRDSETLGTLHILAGLVLLLLQSPLLLEVPAAAFGAVRVAAAGAAAVAQGVLAPVLLLAGWPPAASFAPWRHLARAALGALLALPVLAVFVQLLGSADPIFRAMVERAWASGFAELVPNTVQLAATSWLAAALLVGATRALPPAMRVTVPLADRLPIASAATALVLVELLFALFLGVNARYLLAADEVVRAAAGMSHAEYARKGFFELVAVTALAMPVLLSVHAVAAARTAGQRLLLRVLTLVLLAELVLLLVSAAVRMRLYITAFGLTELRLYTTVAMAWLAALLVWAAATVGAGRRERFLPGAIAWAFAVLLALDVANPEAFIVRWNVTHGAREAPLDLAYLRTLSADASSALAAVDPAGASTCGGAARRWTVGWWVCEGGRPVRGS